MVTSKKIDDIQQQLKKQNLDGWLLYDFRRSNDLAIAFLEIPSDTFLTRRFFYWIPQTGDPIKLVSVIESHVLNSLPGKTTTFQSWQELQTQISNLLKGAKVIAMEYSPMAAIPTLSKVDAGTIELVKHCGVEVVSSAALLQKETSVLSVEQIDMHLEAATVVNDAVAEAWTFIQESLRNDEFVSEVSVQDFILSYFRTFHCITDGRPICAVGAHAADPHYTPDPRSPYQIHAGDFILIDLWCKLDRSNAPFADITRMGVAADSPTTRQEEIFTIVKEARDCAIALIKERYKKGEPVMGWEVDQKARDLIVKAGYGSYFIHRTGHSITTEEHGPGANLDNLETRDSRQLLPGTCFSIEPGIYIPDEIGVRLEVDVIITTGGDVKVTGGVQEAITTLSTTISV
jgi:Xaa-Pro dipeptidase